MSKGKLANLIDAVQAIAQELDADYKAYVRLGELKVSVHMIEARLTNVETLFNEARAIHQKIIESTMEEIKGNYLESLTFHKLKELFFQYSCELKEKLPPADKNNSGCLASGPSVELKLPPMKIPTFDGSLQRWQEFKGLFEGLINKNTSLSDAHKLQYLKGNLTGEAARLLRNTDTNFEAAWALLVKRYQNDRLLKENQFKLLFDQPKLKQESSSDLRALVDITNEARHSLKHLGVSVEAWEDVLIFHTVQKLPAITRGHWETHISSHSDYPTYNVLEDFILMRARALEVIGQSQQTTSNDKVRRSSSEAVHAHNTTTSRCSMCQGSHAIRSCFKFKALDIKKRQELVRTKKLCFNCLSNVHFTASCPSKYTCSTCQKRHHTLLHAAESAKLMQGQELYRPDPNPSPSYSHLHQTRTPASTYTIASAHNASVIEAKSVLLATALVKALTTDGQLILLRALLDPGSEASFICTAAVHLLKLKGEKGRVEILGIGGTNANTAKHRVSFTITSNVNSGFNLQLKAWVLPKLTAMLPPRDLQQTDWSHIHGLKLADPLYSRSNKVDIILGSDVYPNIILDGIVKGEPGTPMAQRTELGWVLSGSIASDSPRKITSLYINTETQTLDNMLRRFWELEEIQMKRPLSQEEEQCEMHFRETHRRQTDGRYVVELPFKEASRPVIGLSQGSAFSRFLQLERRFQRNPFFYEEYKRVFEEYKQLGHMTEIDPNTLSSSHYYVPHHAVLKESSSTTKLRIVFDASCKSSDGTSLNDHLCVGPRLQDDIVDHIARFRKHRIAFAADIEKMYRQIWVTPADAVFQLVLWRDVQGGEIKTYRLNTVTFGTASAPYLAVRTLQQLAIDERAEHPIASDIAKNNFYMDDLIHGADSEAETMEMQAQLTGMLRRAGLPLKKWVSNSPRLLASIPRADREVNLPLTFDEGSTVKTLGIQWHPATDKFTFRISLRNSERNTKRTILSDIARLYDPMGWISPCIILGKILMQQTWRENHSWDEELPQSILRSWHTLKAELQELNAIEIPRWIRFTKGATLEVHGFCDASEKAYAAVIFLRVVQHGDVATNLIISKTRVAPLQTKSLARLELCGAQLLARLLVYTTRTLNIESAKVFAWCDSQITLAWIRSSPHTRTTFVANRVSEIQELTDVNDWRYVPSKENPADIASRGSSPRDLVHNKQWWHGPTFLQIFEKQPYPLQDRFTTNLESKEAKKAKAKECDVLASGYLFKNIFQLCVHVTAFQVNSLLTRFSSLHRLLRATSYWLRFLANLRDKARGMPIRLTGTLSPEEMSTARIRLIKMVQREEFPKEIANISYGELVPKNSKLARLSPIMDENGILRVGGRLENAELPYAQRHPIILPSQNTLTSLIIHDAHLSSLHGGQQLMMATLRSQYWILKLKTNVKKCIHKCLRCYRFRATEMQQQMGTLPAARVNPARPFQTSGVDYAGPIQLKAWKGRCSKLTKAYIAIFVCFCTKGVHLELVSDYTATAFIAAFKRFTARRGICTSLYSDCGTNFKGAAKLLKSENSHFLKQLSDDISQQIQANGTKWHFHPPAAPHFGGLWEAGVKSIKYHLKRIIGHHTLTFEEYVTVLAQIEACLNSRPLYPMSEDPEDLSYLTPGHFLIGASLNTIPEKDLTNTNPNYLQRWQLMQKLQQDFWKKWKTEYLTRLQQRPKWLTPNENIKVGQLVLLPDETPPTLWRLGRITETQPGTDGRIRVVTIKTATSSLQRPITKICPLPATEE